MKYTNGKGIRVSLFVSGCKTYCPECFNKEAQDFTYGQPYTTETESEIIELIKKPEIVGLSILGGDPMWQDELGLVQLVMLCDTVHQHGKNVWLWTGFTYEEIMNGSSSLRKLLLINSDIVVDGKFLIEFADPSLAFRGSSNQRIINVKEFRQKERENRND